jgi:hypothetical protein
LPSFKGYAFPIVLISQHSPLSSKLVSIPEIFSYITGLLFNTDGSGPWTETETHHHHPPSPGMVLPSLKVSFTIEFVG